VHLPVRHPTACPSKHPSSTTTPRRSSTTRSPSFQDPCLDSPSARACSQRRRQDRHQSWSPNSPLWRHTCPMQTSPLMPSTRSPAERQLHRFGTPFGHDLRKHRLIQVWCNSIPTAHASACVIGGKNRSSLHPPTSLPPANASVLDDPPANGLQGDLHRLAVPRASSAVAPVGHHEASPAPTSARPNTQAYVAPGFNKMENHPG